MTSISTPSVFGSLKQILYITAVLFVFVSDPSIAASATTAGNSGHVAVDYISPLRVRLNTATTGHIVGRFSTDEPDIIVGMLGHQLTTTAHNATHRSFTIPAHAQPGSVDASVRYQDGSGEVTVRVYYSDACPTENTYGDGTVCRPCPENAVCPGGDRVWAQQGYYVESYTKEVRPGRMRNEYHVQQCFPASRCRGGPQMCETGYEGEHCGTCTSGYSPRNDECVKCAVGDFISVQLTFIIFIGALLAAVVLLNDKLLSTLLSAIMALQIIAAVGRMATFDMPGWFTAMYTYLAIINLDIEVLSPACLGAPSQYMPHVLLFGNIVFLLAFFLLMVIILGILSVIVPPKREHFRDRMIGSFFFVLSLGYYIVTLRAIQSLFCLPMGPSGDRYLVSQPSTKCYTTAADALILNGSAACILLFFTFGTPLVFVSIMGKNNDKVVARDPRFLARYGPIFDSFKPSQMAFGCTLLLLDKLLAGAAACLRYMPLYQVGAVAAVLLLYLALLLGKRPFKSKVEMTATLCAVATAAVVSGLNATVSVLSSVDRDSSVASTLSAGEDEDGSSFSTEQPVLFAIAITIMVLTFASVLAFVVLFGRRVRSLLMAIRYKEETGKDMVDDDLSVDSADLAVGTELSEIKIDTSARKTSSVSSASLNGSQVHLLAKGLTPSPSPIVRETPMAEPSLANIDAVHVSSTPAMIQIGAKDDSSSEYTYESESSDGSGGEGGGDSESENGFLRALDNVFFGSSADVTKAAAAKPNQV